MEASSRLRNLQPGMTLAIEIAPDQLGKIDKIARVRDSEIISREILSGDRYLLTLCKK